MRINIVQRFKPYSHNPGEKFVVPGSVLGVQIFPTLIKIIDLTSENSRLIAEHSIKLTGPAKDFTIEQDLEKGEIRVWGHYKEGFLRYKIVSSQSGKDYIMIIEKAPPGFQFEEKKGEKYMLQSKQSRLSLGSHKAQDWELMKRRADLAEILPLWHRLGMLTPELSANSCDGTLQLLQKCVDSIDRKDKLHLYQQFSDLFFAAFDGGLFPRLVDTQHQGYGIDNLPANFSGSPLALLTKGAKAIQNMFLTFNNKEIGILESIPPQFHCGRFVDIECEEIGTLSVEWSKKVIRRIVMHANNIGEITLRFQKGLKRFRLRKHGSREMGYVQIGLPLRIEHDAVYYLDNFQT